MNLVNLKLTLKLTLRLHSSFQGVSNLFIFHFPMQEIEKVYN